MRDEWFWDDEVQCINTVSSVIAMPTAILIWRRFLERTLGCSRIEIHQHVPLLAEVLK